ncbi:MAG: hypothetical protein GY702_10625 [Desulfobulbaceae bacterium]|nr:hypothetical protein [Desulfobulbaceae bacterium]
MRRAIIERAKITIGGTVLAKYSAFRHELEVIMVVKTNDSLFGVVTRGRRAHQAFYLEDGQEIEVKGNIVETSVPLENGWKPILSIHCSHMRIGNSLQKVDSPFPDYFEMSKNEIFRKITAHNEDKFACTANCR